jgi:arabinogalactan oligomer / maltooligosaccharide transport system permease protein
MTGHGTTTGFVVKILLLGAVNAIAIFGLVPIIQQEAWAGLAAVVIATIAINWAYLSRTRLPLKYLLPGTLFLLAFQVYPVMYNGFIAFTNYGTGNILTQSQAITRIERASVFTSPDAVRYRAETFADGDEPALLLTDPDGNVFLGTADGVEAVDPADDDVVVTDERIEAVGDFERLTLREAQDRQRDFEALRIPLEDGEIRLTTFREAVRREQRLEYDEDEEVFVDQVEGVSSGPTRNGGSSSATTASGSPPAGAW